MWIIGLSSETRLKYPAVKKKSTFDENKQIETKVSPNTSSKTAESKYQAKGIVTKHIKNNKGRILLALLSKKIKKLNLLLRTSLRIIFVIRYPLIIKNTSTPK